MKVFAGSFFGIDAEDSSNGGFVVRPREGGLQGHIVDFEVFDQVGVFALDLG